MINFDIHVVAIVDVFDETYQFKSIDCLSYQGIIDYTGRKLGNILFVRLKQRRFFVKSCLPYFKWNSCVCSVFCRSRLAAAHV